MSKARNVRKKRENQKEEYDIKKIIIAASILVIVVGLIIGSIIFIKNRNKNRKIEYSSRKYEYFTLYGIDGKVGVVNKNGNEIIKLKYEDIYIPNEEKGVFFCYSDDLEILNERGEKIFSEYEEVNPLRTSDDFVLEFEKEVLRYKEADKYGLIDLDGYKITEPIYQSLTSLKNKPGAILAKKDDKYGVLDSKGNVVIGFKYDDIVGDGYLSQKDGYQKTGYITKIKTKSGDLFGYVDYEGKTILDTKYESIERALEYEDNRLFLICMVNGKKGVFHENKKIIPLEYQNIFYSDISNIFIVQKGSRYGFFNSNGRKILDAIYEGYSLAGNYISVKKDKTTVLYDINGNALNNVNYISMIETENPEYFIAQKENGNYCIISKSITVDEGFSYLTYAFDDYFIFTDSKGKYGVWKVWDGIVIPAEYEYILRIDGKKALEAKKSDDNETDIYSEKMETICTIDGAIVDTVNEKYAVIYSDSEKIYINQKGEIVENTEVYPDNPIYSIKEDNKWGFKDKIGKVVLECKYDFVTELNEYGYAAIAAKGVWGVIDEKGQIIVEPSYKLDVYYMPEFIGKYKIEQDETKYCIEIEGNNAGEKK